MSEEGDGQEQKGYTMSKRRIGGSIDAMPH